jgi:hypothetical protein
VKKGIFVVVVLGEKEAVPHPVAYAFKRREEKRKVK